MPALYPKFFPARSTAVLLLCAAGLLSACGRDKPGVTVDRDGQTAYRTSAEGVEVQVAKDGESLDATDKLPSFAPIYPGSTVKTQLADANGKGAAGGMWVLETSDPVAKVAAFYDEQAKKAGVKPGVFVNEKDSAVRIFGNESGAAGKAEGALIAISLDEEDKMTKIVITAGTAITMSDNGSVKAEAARSNAIPSAPQRLQ